MRFRKKKVGIALGGGAARGLAHIGVLEILQREGIPIDIVAGTSAGALVGAVYAEGKELSVIKDEINKWDWLKLTSLIDLTLPKTGFIEGKKVINELRKFIGGDINFSELKKPLAVVATDFFTGEEVVIKDGHLLEAVRASIAIPILFSVVKWKGRYLLDGSLTNPVPVSVLKEMGADYIIAVNVIPDVVKRINYINKGEEPHAEPTIFNVIAQSPYIANHALVESCMEGSDFVIEPKVVHIGPFEFHRAQECIVQGEIAAQEVVSELKKRLKLK